ncbi:hypothetical protein [Ekhidna sp. To15]|uniref:hypothetical protein n=1 Tax=Ekhidna sp. To15 TaxID=3395267 RepID=UPI003F52808D
MKKISSKNQLKIVVASIGGLFIALSLFALQSVYNQHITLNYHAQFPDEYLKLVDHYSDENKLKESVNNVEKAISSIWQIQKDVESESQIHLDKAVRTLEEVRRKMLKNDLTSKSPAFFALGKILEVDSKKPKSSAKPEEKYLWLLKHNPVIIQKFPLKFIASFLGMTPETLSRVRSKIQ